MVERPIMRIGLMRRLMTYDAAREVFRMRFIGTGEGDLTF